MADGQRDDRVGALKLSYDQMIQERDRLRGARAFFARQLGPLPAFAGISAALVGAFSDKIHRPSLMWIALGVLGVLIFVSMLFSGMPAYRHLRAHNEDEWRKHLEQVFEGAASRAKPAGLRIEDMLDPRDWYIAQIQLERKLYGASRRKNRPKLPRWKLDGANLQDLLDRERAGVFIAQALFVVVIACLLGARL